MIKTQAVLLSLLLGLAGVSALKADEAMRLYPSHPLAKVLTSTAEPAPDEALLHIDGAVGEVVSAQVVLQGGDAEDSVTASLSDLKPSGAGGQIPGKAARLQWVRYLKLSKNSAGVPEDELVARAPTSIPDPFWEDAERPIAAHAVQPLWIELAVPADAAAGQYKGTLSVVGRDRHADLPVTLRVRAFKLPAERHQNVIQWWAFPGRGFEELKPDSDEYWQHLRRSCELLRDHRQTDIRLPWSVIPRKAADDGKGSWDLSLFEKHAELIFKVGMRAIHFTGAGHHDKSQLEQDCRTVASEESLDRLAALSRLVVERGWQGRILTSLADEPFIYQESSFRAVLAQIRKVAPAVGVIEAVETEHIGDLDVFVPKLSHLNLWWPYYENLKRQQKEVWFYTCCHPLGRYPNRFLDQPLVKARELHWISYLYGLDGFLHWGLNWFKADTDPYSEEGANLHTLPPGDSQVIYPGKRGFVGSLRLSAMRDGLQDYEYLWTLEDRLRQIKQRLGEEGTWLDPRQRPLELCRRVVQSCYEHSRDPKVLLATRAAIADEIEALSAEPLLVVQTSPPEGSVVPAGPIMINVRGVTTPGAVVTINGKQIIPQNITAGGYFIDAEFLTSDKQELTITAEREGRTASTRRQFRIVE